MSRSRNRLTAAIATVVVVAALAACGTSAKSGTSSKTIEVVASINAWGSILSQLGGAHVQEKSIITAPGTDPHDYEPTPADAQAIAEAKLLVVNGIGYDTWASKAVAANPVSSRTVLDVGQLVGVPVGGNPHRWYSPADVAKVADAITTELKKLDPTDSTDFAQQRDAFDTTDLVAYHQSIDDINAKYAGIPVGASESIFAPLAEALGLKLITPPSFLQAISEGTDPSSADKLTIDDQINNKKIKVYVFNSQNSTPDVAEQVNAAKKAGIPVVAVTETLSPAGATFQDWQTTQLTALKTALAQATGK